ncbi:hypothetical protein GHT06_003774 [Daphnia sinensis]|uniref:Protein kinase domain-containing protein n=1 Tax=Daphnia sinensis TaxID=1820382 RepID=A0AAD5L277_9CRUS|nr:hypothetical protein GHT06_003774 [Daphnia sinensis]
MGNTESFWLSEDTLSLDGEEEKRPTTPMYSVNAMGQIIALTPIGPHIVDVQEALASKLDKYRTICDVWKDIRGDVFPDTGPRAKNYWCWRVRVKSFAGGAETVKIATREYETGKHCFERFTSLGLPCYTPMVIGFASCGTRHDWPTGDISPLEAKLGIGALVVMERINGVSLDNFYARDDVTGRVFAQVARNVVQMYQDLEIAGVEQTDFKDRNFMVQYDGVPRIVDLDGIRVFGHGRASTKPPRLRFPTLRVMGLVAARVGHPVGQTTAALNSDTAAETFIRQR